MSERKHWRPKVAWAMIIGFVIAYDALCPKEDTLSEEVYRMRQNRLGRFVVDKLIDSVAGHLNQSIPPEEDWIHKIAQISPKN